MPQTKCELTYLVSTVSHVGGSSKLEHCQRSAKINAQW